MRRSSTPGFTLVELLVVIGIIALLLGILLPTLGSARAAAFKIKCGSNLHNIGVGIANYVADNHGVLPASYVYVGHQINNNVQTPTSAAKGYVHWSSYIFRPDQSDFKFASGAGSLGIAIGKPGPYADTTMWGMFQCPALEKGGLNPTNPAPGNVDPGVGSDIGSFVDYQAPRLAYTLNEALCPRNKFVLGFQGCLRTEHFVKVGSVTHSGSTILATEWNVARGSAIATGEVSGTPVYRSHRPLHGFTAAGSTTEIVDVRPGTGLVRVQKSQLTKNPIGGFTPASKLDWVGRNHGVQKLDATGFDERQSNFLYVDGHVEAKSIRDTFSPWQWGDTIFSLDPNYDVANK